MRKQGGAIDGVPLGHIFGRATLQAGEAQLHLLLHLSKGTNGSLRATLDSLEQGVFAIEASSVFVCEFQFEIGAHFGRCALRRQVSPGPREH